MSTHTCTHTRIHTHMQTWLNIFYTYAHIPRYVHTHAYIHTRIYTCRTGSTFATDMYAYGRTIHNVKEACDPRNTTTATALQQRCNNTDVVRTDVIIEALTSSRDYTKRMCASEAVRHAFFKPAKMTLLEQTAECNMCIGEECVEARVNVNMGVTCARDQQHFICNGCLEGLVIASVRPGSDSDSANLSRMSDGKIHCPHCLALRPRVQCEYTDSQLAHALSRKVFEDYIHARMQLLEDRKVRELEVAMQQRLEQVCIYVYTYIHTFVRACMSLNAQHVYIYIYIYICIHAHSSRRGSYKRRGESASASACCTKAYTLYVSLHMCTNVHVCVCIYIYIYT
jgi:hypothetical protein